MTRAEAAPLPELDTIARSWIADGCEAVTIEASDGRVWTWGTPDAKAATATATADNEAGTTTARVTGSTLPTSTALQRDTELVAHFLELHRQVDGANQRFQAVMDFDVTGGVDIDETLDAVLSAATMALGLSTACAWLHVEPDDFHQATVGTPSSELREAASTGHVSPDGAPIHIVDLPLHTARGRMAFLIDLAAPPHPPLEHALARQSASALEVSITYQQSLARARIQNEYELAERVQSTLLPRRSLPTMDGFQFYAESRPARLVGGDFCDFAGGTNRALFFAVGDVSGKGLPAAILMSMTLATLSNKVEFLPNPTPQAIISRANEDMYNHFTDVGMFATALVGKLDPTAGIVSFANSGHSPVIYKPHDGPAELLTAEGTAMGVLTETFAADRSVRLEPGDLFVVASDGLNEQRDPNGAMFGYERLLDAVASLAALPAKEIAGRLFEMVQQHANGTEQDDDQTLLVVRGMPTEAWDLVLPADLGSLRALPAALAEAIGRHAGAARIDAALAARLELAIHEVCVNIVTHGYGDGDEPGDIRLRFGGDQSTFIVDIEDDAPPFDPLQVDPPSLEEAQVHGYGVFLIRELMDRVEYGRPERSNRLSLTKNL